jgi:CRP/FNR family transcriptional regulator, nitrogen oxide reductase regulator
MPQLSSLAGFRVLPEAERAVIDRAVREIAVHRGQVLFGEGTPADSLWAVHHGKVHIMKSGPEGREIVLEVVTAGELFGAVVAIEGRPYPASAIAVDDGSVWRLPASVTRDLCQRYPTLRNAIMEQVTVRLRNAHERLRSVALEKVEQRLARAVLALAAKIGTLHEGKPVLSVTRQELADMTGTTVESAIRVTSRWQTARLIDTARNQIELLDVPSLQSIASGERS